MFWKAWKPNQQAMPAAATRPNTSVGTAEIASARQITTPSSAISTPGADQAELLAGDGEDEVGVLLGHEAGPGLRAVEQPLAEQAAVADRDPGLLGVVAGAARVEVGVGEGQEPVDLVGLQQVAGERRRRPTVPPAAASSTSQRRRSARRRRARRRRWPRAPAGCRGRAGAGSARPGRRRSRSMPTTSTAPTCGAGGPRRARRPAAPSRSPPRAWRTPTAGSTSRRRRSTTASR